MNTKIKNNRKGFWSWMFTVLSKEQWLSCIVGGVFLCGNVSAGNFEIYNNLSLDGQPGSFLNRPFHPTCENGGYQNPIPLCDNPYSTPTSSATCCQFQPSLPLPMPLGVPFGGRCGDGDVQVKVARDVSCTNADDVRSGLEFPINLSDEGVPFMVECEIESGSNFILEQCDAGMDGLVATDTANGCGAPREDNACQIILAEGTSTVGESDSDPIRPSDGLTLEGIHGDTSVSVATNFANDQDTTIILENWSAEDQAGNRANMDSQNFHVRVDRTDPIISAVECVSNNQNYPYNALVDGWTNHSVTCSYTINDPANPAGGNNRSGLKKWWHVLHNVQNDSALWSISPDEHQTNSDQTEQSFIYTYNVYDAGGVDNIDNIILCTSMSRDNLQVLGLNNLQPYDIGCNGSTININNGQSGLDSVTVSKTFSGYHDINNLDFTIMAEDVAQNVKKERKRLTVRIDTALPVIHGIAFGRTSISTSQNSPTDLASNLGGSFSLNIEDPVQPPSNTASGINLTSSTITIVGIDGANLPNITLDQPFALTALPLGTSKITVNLIDNAGNSASGNNEYFINVYQPGATATFELRPDCVEELESGSSNDYTTDSDFSYESLGGKLISFVNSVTDTNEICEMRVTFRAANDEAITNSSVIISVPRFTSSIDGIIDLTADGVNLENLFNHSLRIKPTDDTSTQYGEQLSCTTDSEGRCLISLISSIPTIEVTTDGTTGSSTPITREVPFTMSIQNYPGLGNDTEAVGRRPQVSFKLRSISMQADDTTSSNDASSGATAGAGGATDTGAAGAGGATGTTDDAAADAGASSDTTAGTGSIATGPNGTPYLPNSLRVSPLGSWGGSSTNSSIRGLAIFPTTESRTDSAIDLDAEQLAALNNRNSILVGLDRISPFSGRLQLRAKYTVQVGDGVGMRIYISWAPELEFLAPPVGADIEGQIIGDTDLMDLADDVQIVRMGGVSMTDIRTRISRNAIQLMRGNEIQSINTFNPRDCDEVGEVFYFKPTADGNIVTIDTADASITGVCTVVISDGNLWIKQGFIYAESADASIGFILVNSDPSPRPAVGNIFVDDDVMNIVGTYYADGTFTTTTTTTTTPTLIVDSTNYVSGGTVVDVKRDTTLNKQLLLEGTLFTRNTLGGATVEADPFDPWGVAITEEKLKKMYDLNFVRRYANTGRQHCVLHNNNCDPNPHSFVIRPDGRVTHNTPPGFTN